MSGNISNPEFYSGRTFTDNTDRVLASDFNQILANIKTAEDQSRKRLLTGIIEKRRNNVFIPTRPIGAGVVSGAQSFLGLPLDFDRVVIDTEEIWNSSEPSRVYIPQNVFYMQVSGWFQFMDVVSNPPADKVWAIQLTKNNTEVIRYIYYKTEFAVEAFNFGFPIMIVQPNDFFELRLISLTTDAAQLPWTDLGGIITSFGGTILGSLLKSYPKLGASFEFFRIPSI